VNINITDKENCRKEFEAELSYEELTPYFEEALLKYRKKAQIPGFRKGKVPVAMLKKMYGDSVEYGALEDIANDVFKKHIIDNKIPMFGTGSLLDIDYKPKEKLTFKVAFDVIPDVELRQIKDIELTKTNYVIDDSLIDEELNYMKLKSATFEIDGQATDDDYMVTLDTEEIDSDGNTVEGRSQKDMRLFIGSEYVSKDYYDGIKGIKEGEERTIDTVNENKEPVKVKLKCTKVEKVVYPEMNKETFMKMTGREDIESEDQMKSFIKEEITKQYNDHSYNSLKNKVISEVVKLNDIEIPESYVNEMLKDYFNNYKKEHKGHKHEINEEEFNNKNRAEVVFTGKWFLIKDKIVEQEKVEVTEDDVKAFAEEAGKHYGIPGDKMYEFYKDNKEVKHTILDKKVVDFLIENAKITEIEEVKKSIKLLAEEKKSKSQEEKKSKSQEEKKTKKTVSKKTKKEN